MVAAVHLNRLAIEVNRRYLSKLKEEEEEGLLPPELPEVPANKK